MHQHDVDRHAVQPGRESGFTTKRPDFAEQLQEGFLGQVFGFRGIRGHAQAEGVHSPFMKTIQDLESLRVALLGPLDRFRFAESVALSLLSVGQVAFSGRTNLDAAKYLCVVLLAGIVQVPKITIFRIQNNKLPTILWILAGRQIG